MKAEYQKPEISVVMSVYNGAQYLKESVESILNQEGVALEFIIVNDGSTDSSQSILEQYQQKDSRIRLFTRENQGLTKALIFGCSEAKAAYIARQDADDVSSPGRLQKLHALLSRHQNMALASSWVSYVGPVGEFLGLVRRPENPEVATSRLINKSEGPPAHGSVMFRKSSYSQSGGYRPEFYYGQDSDLWLRMCSQGQVGYVGESLYTYRFSLDSISVGESDIQQQFGQLGQRCRQARDLNEPEDRWIKLAEELSRKVRSGSVAREPHHLRRAKASYFLGSNLHRQRNPAARRYLRQAIRYNPWKWRAWLKLAQGTFIYPRVKDESR